MEESQKYTIVKSADIDVIIKKVNVLITEGWLPHGSLQVGSRGGGYSDFKHYQAMTYNLKKISPIDDSFSPT